MRKNKLKGFSLIEMMIVSSMMVVIIGVITNSLSAFMKYSTKNALEDQAQYDINNIIKIIENDIHASNKTLTSATITQGGTTTTISSGETTLIMSEPVLNEYTVPIVDTSGNQVFDTVIITVDSTNKKYLRYIVIPNSLSSRKASNKIIYRSLNPSITNIFNYYNTSTTITADYNKVTMVKFSIDALIDYNPSINIKRYSEAKLLNFGI